MLPPNTRPLARLVLLSLLVTFVVLRLVNVLVMLHRMPDLYLHVRDIHVHHLNYGIFLLLVGSIRLAARVQPRIQRLELRVRS